MARRSLTVTEARKQLPRLIQEVTRGGGPFYLGARGQATAVLVSASQWHARETASVLSEGLGTWSPLRLEILGDPADLEDDIRALREHAVASSLERSDRVTPRPASPRKPASRPASKPVRKRAVRG